MNNNPKLIVVTGGNQQVDIDKGFSVVEFTNIRSIFSDCYRRGTCVVVYRDCD
jgi:hypothetical protein